MFKNVASQKIAYFAFDTTTSAPKTGDAANITAYVSKDFGTVTVLGDTSATEADATNAKGVYWFDLTQAETNGDFLQFSAKSTTANVSLVPLFIYTTPPNFSTLALDSSGNAKIQTPLKKGVARAAFPFVMIDSTTGALATGKTVSVTRSIDGGAFGAGTLSAVTEVGSGLYTVDFGTGDTNGSAIVLKATATGCNTTIDRIFPET